MSTKEVVSEYICASTLYRLGRTIRDFYRNPCEATITLVVIFTYEAAIIVFTYRYSNNKVANWKYLCDKLNGRNRNNILFLRNDLAHNFQKYTNVIKYINDHLYAFGRDDFKVIENELFGYDIGLYEDILNYCKEGIVGE